MHILVGIFLHICNHMHTCIWSCAWMLAFGQVAYCWHVCVLPLHVLFNCQCFVLWNWHLIAKPVRKFVLLLVWALDRLCAQEFHFRHSFRKFLLERPLEKFRYRCFCQLLTSLLLINSDQLWWQFWHLTGFWISTDFLLYMCHWTFYNSFKEFQKW